VASLCIEDAQVIADWRAKPVAASVLIEGERIAAIATAGDDRRALAARARSVMDARGLALIPGMVNAHHHAYGNVLRGTENSLPLELWALHTVAWGRALDGDMLRLAILIGAAEMLRGGVTACVDHFPHVRNVEPAYRAHRESGMRVAFAPFLHDIHDHDFLEFDLPADIRAALGTPFFPVDRLALLFRDLVAQARADRGLVAIFLGPNAPQRCSPGLLALWRSLRDELDIPVHTHLLETWPQAARSRALWDGGLVAEMARQGLLDARLSAAHGVWLMESERDLLARHGVAVSHNPASNLMVGSGACPTGDYRARGVALALGSDSANTGGRADMFELMRLAMMLPRHAGADWRDWPRARDSFRMASEGGARVLCQANGLGRIAEGAPADLVLVDLGGATRASLDDGVETLVQHGSPDCVRAVMVGGTWVYRDGRVLAFDEDQALRDFAECREAIRQAAAPALRALETIMPAMDAALRGFRKRHPLLEARQ
jgi:5-methylthioadenosine/S-adenosylhomocysteine deaminase